MNTRVWPKKYQLENQLVFVYGGAGGIWTPVRKPSSHRSTCLAVWFESRHRCRAVARYTGRQHPWISPPVKMPDRKPADVNNFTAWTAQPCDQSTLAQPIGLLL